MNELKALIYATKTIDRRKQEDVDTNSAVVKDDIDDIAVTSITVSDTVAGEILTQAMEGITGLIMDSGPTDFNLSSIHEAMEQSEAVMIGMGEGEGPDRMEDAVLRAIRSPLLDTDTSGSTAALVNIIGGPDLTLADAEGVVKHVHQVISSGARIIWGVQIHPDLQGFVRVTLMLAGVRAPHICGRNE